MKELIKVIIFGNSLITRKNCNQWRSLEGDVKMILIDVLFGHHFRTSLLIKKEFKWTN